MMNWEREINWLWSIGCIEKDEAMFLLDCLRWEGLPECFGRCNSNVSSCQSRIWVKRYRICRICEKVSDKLKRG
jgi:ActR/RegA family two-component response regulator